VVNSDAVTGNEKLEVLKGNLKEYGSLLVAYSGGVDSSFLVVVAHEVLKDKMLAVIADSPSLPRRELEEALALVKQRGIPIQVLKTMEMQNPEYTENPPNRCYFCKAELFKEMEELASNGRWSALAYGEIADDIGDHRPGAIAARNFKVVAPLKEAHLTKAEIRELSAQMNLPTADKPAMACLSSRIPYGQPVTVESLSMIEKAEGFLKALGLCEVRVRHHDFNGLKTARIELPKSELEQFISSGYHEQAVEAFIKLGYTYVTLDLAGYKRGSLNAALKST